MTFPDNPKQEAAVCTDGDLKRLEVSIGDGYGWWHEQLKTTGLQALLARLKAAEAYAEFRLRFSSGHDGEKEKLEAWLRSTGK